MNIYDKKTMGETIKGNEYVGRGIVIGMTEDAKKAAIAYFIMGRSENSRNRVFREEDNSEVVIYPFDESKVEDQTQTIYEFLEQGKCFHRALNTRCFEPDGPNWTPRISGIVYHDEDSFDYQMSILKSGDAEGTVCNRFLFSYKPIAGLGHFLHTYVENGDPIPTFQGEPERVSIPNDIDEFFNDIWENLDENNKISLYVRYIDLATGEEENRLVNKNQ